MRSPGGTGREPGGAAWGRTAAPLLLLSALLLSSCAGTDTPVASSGAGTSTPSPPSARGYKVGKPYQIKGVWYYPKVDYEYRETGIASWYGPGFHGRDTANGETYDMNDLTAAHRTLPMPSLVRVTNLENGRSLQLRVNDRGPFYGDRIIDVSRRAAQMLGFYGAGTAQVEVEIMAEESRQMAAALGVPVDGLPPPAVQAAAAAPAPAQQPPPSDTAPLDPLAAAEPLPDLEPAAVETWAASPEPPAFAGDPAVAADDVAYANAMSGQPAPEPVETLPVAAPEPYLAAAPPLSQAVPGDRRTLYVQAGAFADADRAARVRQRLAWIGPVVLSPSHVNGRELLRVRVGPLASDAEADQVLASVSRAGFPDSRLVVE